MKHIKLFENFKEAKTAAYPISHLTSLQFYKLIDLLEADITAYDADDIDYYEDICKINVGTLLDLYASYGYKAHKYAETEKLKNAYMKAKNKTWEQIQKEAEKAE
jgi:hypothetical protein